MATSFSIACDALVRERDRAFLQRVADDYKLSFEELSAKYLETSEAAIKVPRKYTKKPKSVEVETTDKKCCTAQTSKKEPCKFSALKGEVFCLRHLKQSRGEKPDKASKKAVKESKTEPVHTHPVDTKPTEPCDVCETYGEPFGPVPTEFTVKKSAADRLAEILAEADSDSGSDTEVELDDQFVEDD